MYFIYGDTEKQYLKKKDSKMNELIAQIGHIYRDAEPDFFCCVVRHILSQQASSAEADMLLHRLKEYLGSIDDAHVLAVGSSLMQSIGISRRKADYIMEFAARVNAGEFDGKYLSSLKDNEILKALCTITGISVWDAEMIMLFCMQRPDVFSYSDLSLLRGLRMVYGHKTITKELFEKYRRRLSPYCSTASLYLWAAAGGAVAGLSDPASPKAKQRAAVRTD